MPIADMMKITLVHFPDLPLLRVPVRLEMEPPAIISRARTRDFFDHDFGGAEGTKKLNLSRTLLSSGRWQATACEVRVSVSRRSGKSAYSHSNTYLDSASLPVRIQLREIM